MMKKGAKVGSVIVILVFVLSIFISVVSAEDVSVDSKKSLEQTGIENMVIHTGDFESAIALSNYFMADSNPDLIFDNYEICIANQGSGRKKLVGAIEELEQTILNSIDLDIRQVADSYALLATATELTPWWRELARLALDTISAVVGTAINVGEFLTPEGANQVLEDVSTSQQIFKELKDSKNILGCIAAIQGLAGLYRNADSYKLSFEAINTVEEVARQEYEESGDNYRTSNAAWLELWLPSTPNGLLIPLKTGTPTKEGSRSSVTSWVNGIKEVREEVKNSFDNVINEIPDPLPADYPLDETITYINNLKQQIRGSGYRIVKFKCVEDDKVRKRHITLGMVRDGNEVTNELYDAWMHDLDVQYTSTVYKTSKTIVQVTTYGVPATGVTKKVMKGVSDLYEVVDIIHIPSDLGNLIDKPVHPLDALQNHTVKMNNDLVHETSNLWALSDGTLKYLQYTWESETTSDPIVIAPGLGEKAANLAEEVVGAPYLSGGKGFDYDTMKFVDSATIKSGYRYWNAVKGQLDWGEGLDCSGLSFWAFNKAAGATKHQDPANPIYYEGASGQWADTERFKQISTTIPSVSDLNTGYLLFLDTPPIKGAPDHVGMYVGNGYVIHSRGSVGVEKKTLNGWLDIPYGNKKYKDYFWGYGRVKVVSGDTFNIGDIVRVTTNLNVRPKPGSSFEITDPDYPGYAPTGTIGIVLSGPSSADSYIWWEVDYGPGLYSGWSVEDWLEKKMESPVIKSTKFKTGDFVRVIADAGRNIRTKPKLGKGYIIDPPSPLQKGSEGQVIEHQDNGVFNDEHYWWYLRFGDYEGWCAEDGLDQPPICAIELRKEGAKIDEIDVGEFFDIYVRDSTDDTGISEVGFSIDESQDDNPTGEWTEWYDWDTSSGDWDADTNIKKWSFDTGGAKEVWAEVKDDVGQSAKCSANIHANPPIPQSYAIIVAGQGGHIEKPAIDHSANNAYRVLRNLGFDNDHIFYLNSNRPQDVDGDEDDEIDALASFSNFDNAINEVKDKIEDNPTLFILFLTGHGLPGQFLFDGSILYDYQLKGMLEEFPSETRMLIFIDSCYSGVFITSINGISASNRIIITGTHNDQKRLWIPWLRSSDRFWGNLNKGLNVKDAFITGAWPGEWWHLWLNDNGDIDRIGSPPNNLGEDGNLAARTQIGVPGTENLKLTPWIFVWKRSPGELRVYDSQNQVTGLVNGEVKEEIPDSIYDEQDEIVALFSPSDTYRYEVAGTDEGTYGLDIASIKGAEATIFTATDIPTTSVAVHQYTIDWAALSQGEKGVTVKIDSDGNGTFGRTIITNNSFQPFIAEFTVSPKNPIIGEKVTLDASTSFDLGGGVIKKYCWEFYNAANQDPFYVIEGHDKKIIRYTFTSEGIYLVRLTVTDDEGECSYTESSITIKAPVFYVPDDYSSIQAAVDAASAGDTIIVRDGTYTENVDIDKSITLKSSSGNPEYTIVEVADFYNHVFSVTADHVKISGFTVTEAPAYGIYLHNADYCDISDNICSHSAFGIYLEGSNSNSISDNTCINNEWVGISLNSSTKNSISNNTCSNNGYNGIGLACSTKNSISNNTCSNNGYGGICLECCNQNSISNNLCSNNELGIEICPCWSSNNNCSYLNNCIYLNNFINNDCNAYSHSSTDTWYSPVKLAYTYNGKSHTNYLGNYWSDYTGTDANKNGIGDSPYSIDDRDGDIDQDYYPLMTWSEHYFPSPTIPTPPKSTLTPTPRPTLTPPRPTLTPTPRPRLRPTATLFEEIEGLIAAIRVCW